MQVGGTCSQESLMSVRVDQYETVAVVHVKGKLFAGPPVDTRWLRFSNALKVHTEVAPKCLKLWQRSRQQGPSRTKTTRVCPESCRGVAPGINGHFHEDHLVLEAGRINVMLKCYERTRCDRAHLLA